MAELLFRIGRACARRARTVITVWVAVLIVAGGAFALAGGTLANSFSIPGTPTAEVTDRLQSEFPEAAGGSGTVVLHSDDEFSDEQKQAIGELVATAGEVDGVTAAVDPFQTEAAREQQASDIETGRGDIADGLDQIEAGRAKIEAGQDELEAAQDELDAAREQAETSGTIDQAGPQLDAQQEKLDESADELDTRSAELETNATELEQQSDQLENGAALLDMSSEIRTVSHSGDTAVAMLSFDSDGMMIPEETANAIVAVFDEEPVDGVEVDFSTEIAGGVPEVFGVGEAVGLIVAAIVLIMMLGTLVGAGLPLLNALVGVGIGSLIAMSLSGVVEIASVTPILGIMLGLAVGIDYSLFIINRHRRQLKNGYDVAESIALANGTSGNAVVFAGATVIIALLALNVTGVPFLGLMGSVGAMCIAISVLIAVTLTPALLKLIGTRILSRKERAASAEARPTSEAASARSSRPMPTWRAVGIVVACVAGLLVVALPALGLRLNLPDGSSEAHDSTQYQAYDTIADEFGAGQNGTLLVVAELPGSPNEQEVLNDQVAIAEAVYDQPGVEAVAPIGTSQDGTVAAFQAVPSDGPTSESTEQLVHTLRDGSATFSTQVSSG
ncbi:MAG: MMPL family transporter, partial [Stackebrandtia sp.]